MENAQLVQRVRLARRRQDADAVLALVSPAFERGEATVRLVLEAARAELSAGRVDQSRQWIARARSLSPQGAEAVILDLEEAQIRVLAALDLGGARNVAQAACQHFERNGEPVPAAVAWLATRLLLAAAIYREIGAAEAAAIWRGLRRLQGRLKVAGLIDQAHAVAFKRAERARWPLSIRAWNALAALGRRDGNPATSGDAHLLRAAAIRENGGAAEDIEAALQEAQSAYAEIDHRVGPLAIARERALIAIDRQLEPLAVLERCADDFLAAGCPKEALSTLLDVATRAHRKGDRRTAERSRQRLAQIAGTTGYHLVRLSDVLAHADLALRERDDARARDLCDQALAEPMPAFNRAGILAIRGSAFSFAGDRVHAIEDRRHSIALYERLGAEAEASDLIAALAADIAATRSESDLDEADKLLTEWAERDRARKATLAAAIKTVERAGLCILRALGRRLRHERPTDEPALIAEGEALLATAERALDPATNERHDLTRAEVPALIGKAAQIRAQLATLASDTAMMLAAQEKALAAYEQVGMPYEAAGCRYLIGCLLLNQSSAAPNDQFGPIAEKAETHLSQALHYFDDVAGMRHQAALTRHKLAMLYLNAQHRFVRETADKFCANADALLESAADDLDIVRQSFQADARLDSFSTKSDRSAEATDIDREALRLHLQLRPENSKAWAWTVRSKARALNDILGAEALLPPDAAAAAKANPEIGEMIESERRLADALATARAAQRLELRPQLAGLRERMRREPVLRGYVDLRSGAPAGPDDLAAIGAAARRFALIDWVAVQDRIFILVARPGEEPAIEPLALGLRDVEESVRRMLGPRSFRITLKDDPASLEEFEGLVAPLEWLTAQGEHLILCPTTILHRVPFPALRVEGQVLLERNPLADIPSLGVLRLACQHDARGGSGVAVFGDPTADRPDARRAAQRIADRLRVSPQVAEKATLTAFEDALVQSHLVHYQGHATHDRAAPLSSHLKLADGRLEARRLFEMRGVACRMIQLGACEGAALDYRGGDEPFGLISALLIAGVRAVTAASWNVQETSAGLFMDRYIECLTSNDQPILALQKAAMAVRAHKDEDFSAPYHWAPFRLYGDPWRSMDAR